MGIKPAANYFQMTMTQHIFKVLIYEICEVFNDDVLIFGCDEDDYLRNTASVFERLRDKKVTINPEKCIFSAPEVNFVGHVINKHVPLSQRQV
jgi:hypothetical protein